MRYFWCTEERKFRMKTFKFVIFIILLAFTLPYMYGGCVIVYSSGDLNNDKEQNVDQTAIEFNGNTSQAAITPLNAGSLAAGAFAGGLSEAPPDSLKSSQRPNDARIDVFRPLKFPLVLMDSLRRIELDAELNISSHSNIITESNNLKGSCGGELSYTLTFNRTSGTFNGDLLFTGFCEDGISVSGATDVSGDFEVSSGIFDTAVFSFDDLADESHSLDGEISMDFTETPIVATITAYSKNKETGQTYWLKDYSINLTEFYDHVEIEVFGTFYHPDNGFVTLTTPEPFVVFGDDDWPSTGQLAVQGNGSTKVQLIAMDQLRYRLEADTDGDGVFDWDSEILNWTDL